jgi:hypothetical protein
MTDESQELANQEAALRSTRGYRPSSDVIYYLRGRSFIRSARVDNGQRDPLNVKAEDSRYRDTDMFTFDKERNGWVVKRALWKQFTDEQVKRDKLTDRPKILDGDPKYNVPFVVLANQLR